MKETRTTTQLPAQIPTLDFVLSEAERAHIERVLGVMKGNISETASTLGVTRQGLYKKMKRLGIREDG